MSAVNGDFINLKQQIGGMKTNIGCLKDTVLDQQLQMLVDETDNAASQS